MRKRLLWQPSLATHSGDPGQVRRLPRGEAGDRWGRPVDAVAGPDGALYVSDDTAGAVYRLAPPG